MFAPRITGLVAATLVVVVAATTAPAADAAPPVIPNTHAMVPATSLAAHHRGPLSAKALTKAHPTRSKVARAASVSNAWNGASATCVGTAMSLSMGRNFGLPLGTHFAWRSRLLVFDSRTGTSSFTSYGPWLYDQMPNPNTYTYNADGTVTFTMGTSGGVLPTYSPTDAWTGHGVWVYPYVQVNGYGERPVNITGVAGTGRYSDPNWCYLG